MKTFREQYKRLPGRSKSLFAQGRQHLYLAEDHILVVNPGTYSEESYRIVLGDIQAVTVTKTMVSKIMLVLTGMLIIVFNVFLMNWFGVFENLEELSIELYVVLGIYNLPLIVLFVVIVVHGPTCKCILRTAVKQHHLSSLGRVRTAKKAIAMIAQAAYAQQGNFAVVVEEEQTTNEHE